MIVLPNQPLPPPGKVDISLLLKPQDEEEATRAPITTAAYYKPPPLTAQLPLPAAAGPSLAAAAPVAGLPAGPPVVTAGPSLSVKAGTKRLQPAHTAESPAKKQSKWSPEEDALIIELRGSGMKWEDISKRLPGRSAISCRLHYQNYLERRSEWDEDKKNKLARLYERFKAEMWSKVAEEMAIPWRAAEAMHWQLGEQEMARRAGVVPFSLSSAAIDPPATRTRRTSLSRPRKDSASRHLPSQLPSVEELTAGVPAYAPAPPPREPYQIGRPPPLINGPPPGSFGPVMCFPPPPPPPRTLP
ncbi:hypothetical protein ASPZODRAFT_154139 [Penicilliopsis zonata CBS 506.65]|uniref:MYB DNA-binding domain protein n=1 Tax=Penicilliopsis zonata CBS 506.65 TaxID=1073090 RepID=A0A1L9SAN1_9EURO|nr:hypothetical protein ASPZODRAFT_154139 [Penicilliopsis zonata CBS 506.65]OJJ44187.1 hypothetical protein ASPZODRAFT_154139 [Penicilliopsis zonata CBS 506.65]